VDGEPVGPHTKANRKLTKNKPISMISLVQSHDLWRQSRNLLWWGFVEKAGFEPGVKEWRSNGCWK